MKKVLLWGHRDFPGLIPFTEDRLFTLEADEADRFLSEYGREEPCPACEGSRLKRESAAVRVGPFRIQDLVHLTVG